MICGQSKRPYRGDMMFSLLRLDEPSFFQSSVTITEKRGLKSEAAD